MHICVALRCIASTRARIVDSARPLVSFQTFGADKPGRRGTGGSRRRRLHVPGGGGTIALAAACVLTTAAHAYAYPRQPARRSGQGVDRSTGPRRSPAAAAAAVLSRTLYEYGS